MSPQYGERGVCGQSESALAHSLQLHRLALEGTRLDPAGSGRLLPAAPALESHPRLSRFRNAPRRSISATAVRAMLGA